MNRSAIAVRLAVCAAVAAIEPSAFADVGATFGFGSRAAGMAGAVVAGPNDGFDAYSNPAKMTDTGENRWSFSYGIIYMQPSFTSINNVTIENNYTSEADLTGNVTTDDYKATFGQEIGLSYRLIPDGSHLTFGVVTYLPVDQVAYTDTGETFEPEYVLYRARTNRPQIELALAADLGSDFHIGLGGHFAFSLAANADAYIQSTAGHPSTMRFSATLQPKLAPYLGFLYTPNKTFSAGLVFRFPVASNNTTTLNTGARVVGFLPSIPLAFTAHSTLYYDPLTVELGASEQIGDDWRVAAQIDFERWSKFQAPAMIIDTASQQTGGSGTTVQFSPGTTLEFPYRDIYTPRIGAEYTMGQTILRAGYSYHESIFSSVPDDAGNYLDPSKHMFNVGAGFHFENFLGGVHPWTVDLHASYDLLITQHIVKTPGDETGASGDTKIGAPGYDAGGKEYGGGASLTVEF